MSKKKEFTFQVGAWVPQTFYVQTEVTIEAKSKEEALKKAQDMSNGQLVEKISYVDDDIIFDPYNVIDDLKEARIDGDLEVDYDSIEEI